MVRIAISTLLLALLSLPQQGFAMRVKLLTLEQIVERAEIIFVGRCLTSTVQEDAHIGQTVTLVEFEVTEALQGGLGHTHALKQYGGVEQGKGHRIAGMPTYTPGEEVILFLYAESQYGLASPVGGSQGKFTVIRDTDSSPAPMVVNSINNNGLLMGLAEHGFLNAERMDASKRNAIRKLVRVSRGPIPYEDFLVITKALIRGEKTTE